jgi:hypothetical protein
MRISDLARRWIVANFVAMVATAAVGLLGFGLHNLLDLDSADAVLSAKICYVAAEIIMTAACLAVYAQLTGAVLRQIVPAFPWRSWLAIHLVTGSVAGAATGVAAAGPGGDSEPIDWNDTGFLVFMFAVVPIGGAVLGSVIGGLQALILRRVARGAGAWIAFSALATSVTLSIVVGAFPFSPLGSTFAAEAVMQGVTVLAGVVNAIMMLPALRRLRPGTDEG